MAKRSTIPTLEEHAGHAAAIATLESLKAEQLRIETAYNELLERFKGKTEAQIRATQAAQRLLAGGAIGSDEIAAASQHANNGELDTLKQQLAVISEAISLQAAAVAEQLKLAGAAMLEAAGPAHKAIAKLIGAAITALESALDEDTALRDQLQAAGMASQLRDVRFLPAAFNDKTDGQAARWRREHADYVA